LRKLLTGGGAVVAAQPASPGQEADTVIGWCGNLFFWWRRMNEELFLLQNPEFDDVLVVRV
jgi:hypothetical protein